MAAPPPAGGARSRRWARREFPPGRPRLCRVLSFAAQGLAAALLAVFAATFAAPAPAADPEEGDLRLTGGGDRGRLQVYYDDRWGAVCDDGFRLEEADVACRQLGYQGADSHFSATHWSSSFTIWLDDVDCDGTEDRLTACSTSDWGVHNCSRREHVGVRCTVAPTDPQVLLDLDSLAVAEGGTASYAIRLGKEPTGNVTIAVSGTSGTNLTVSPASLTFTTENWSIRQTVTVSAAADIDVGDDVVTLTHSASGGGYGSVTVADVTVTVDDRDVPRVVIDPRVVTVGESDATGGSYTVVLSGGRPTGDVTVTVAGHGGTDVSVSSASLTFTTTTWDEPQTVTVTAASDSDALSDTVTLTHSAAGGGYGLVSVPSVEVRVEDDDIQVTASPPQLAVDEDGSATYALRTVGGPWDSLTVSVEAPAGAGFTVSPSTVTFTRSDWDTPRTISVSGREDGNWVDNTWTVAHSVGGSGTIAIEDVAVTVDDLGPLGAWIGAGAIVSLDEGSGTTYGVRLSRDPGGTATVSVSSSSPSKLSVSPASLSFDSSNWNRDQTVTIEAEQDSDSADENVRLRHAIAQAGLEASLPATQVRITDDDDGTSLIGARPEAANVWWAALTAGTETGGVVGHIDYNAPAADTGKLSDDRFTYDGVGREIDAVYLDRTGHFQIWVDSGTGAALPNDLVLHVGSASMTLGSATRQSFGTIYTEGMTPMLREHTYWWQSGSHSVAFSNRQAVAVWLEETSRPRSLPGTPQSVQGTPGDGKVQLQWVAPPGTMTRSEQQVLHYEYQQEGTEGWTATDGPGTTEEVEDLVNGESYRFRVRAVNAEGKGAASAPSAPVTPSEATGLTGAFASVPASHDGSSAFTLRIEFSDDIAPRFRRKRGDVFEMTGGTVQDLRRVNRRRDLWDLTVAPSSDGPVTIVMAADRACDAAGAVCTADGARLSAAVETTVPGPPPTLTGASVDGATLTLSHDEALDEDSAPDADAFAVTVEGVARSVDAVVVSGSSVTLTLASAVEAGEAVTLSYTVPTGADATPIRDAAGNAAAAFSDRAVTNETVASNAAPTGLPTISGTAEVGETLTASSSGIADADGLANAVFAWQWIANDGTTDAEIAGATGSTYTLTAAEVGKTIKVRVTFSDDGGTEEVLTSAATSAVEPQLIARFESLPASHDGSTPFSFELHFSEEITIGKGDLRRNALEVRGASISNLERLDPPSNAGWTITLTPSTDDRVTIRLRPRETCDESGAICTAAGKLLLNQLGETVQGPTGLAAPNVAQAGAGEPVTVPADWGLKPADIAEGEQFRLVFVTSGRSAADSGNIGTYDAFIQSHANSGHPDMRQYGSRFKVVGSTLTADARDHTGTNPRLGSGGPGVPIYWLNGPKAADDYRDFYDDAWDHFNPGRNESGAPVRFGNADTVWTGTQHGGQGYAHGHLGHATTMRVGRPYSNNPISRGTVPKSSDGNAGRMYGLSPIFQVAVSETVETSVSIAAGTSPVTEGEAAVFTLTRTGDAAAALTVGVSVTEAGSVLSGTPATEVEFAAGSATAELGVATDDDSVAEADGRVTATVSEGTGYAVDADAGTASVDVFDNDEVASGEASVTLWSSTLEWTDMGGGWLIAYSENFTSASWSEDGDAFSIWYIAYDPANGALWLQLTSEMPAGGIPAPAELALQVGTAAVGAGEAMAAFASGTTGIASGIEQSWSAGESVAVVLTRTVEAEEAAVSGPGLTVADAEVQEAEGAVLSFPVTLDSAQASAVSVRYATSDVNRHSILPPDRRAKLTP